jgi:hypothetical protein
MAARQLSNKKIRKQTQESPKDPTFARRAAALALVGVLSLPGCSLPPELEAEYRRSITGITAQIDANEAVRRELLTAWQRGEVTEEQYRDRVEVIEGKEARLVEAREGVETAYKEARAGIIAAGIARVGVIGGDLLGALSPLLLVFLPGVGPVLGVLRGLLGRLRGKANG